MWAGSGKMRPVRISLVILGSIASAVSHSQSVRADNQVSFSIIPGERTAQASAVAFDPIETIGGRTLQFGSGVIEIDDASGTNAGWRVAVALIEVGAPKAIAGQQIDKVSGPVPAKTPGDLASPRTVLAAQPGFGDGVYRVTIWIARDITGILNGASAPLDLTVTIAPGI
jgi:hypothetical protein